MQVELILCSPPSPPLIIHTMGSTRATERKTKIEKKAGGTVLYSWSFYEDNCFGYTYNLAYLKFCETGGRYTVHGRNISRTAFWCGLFLLLSFVSSCLQARLRECIPWCIQDVEKIKVKTLVHCTDVSRPRLKEANWLTAPKMYPHGTSTFANIGQFVILRHVKIHTKNAYLFWFIKICGQKSAKSSQGKNP